MKPRLLSCLFATAAIAAAESYQIGPAEGARMELSVEKTGLLRGKKHLFVFEQYRGTLQYDPQRPGSSEVRITIDARSASCRDTWVSAKDLRKIQEYALKEMLAAEQYPKITFASSAIREVATGRYEVQGMLTIRGLAKPAVVMVSVNPGPLSFQGNAQLRLSDYGLKRPSAALGTIGTKDEMSFSFSFSPAARRETL